MVSYGGAFTLMEELPTISSEIRYAEEHWMEERELGADADVPVCVSVGREGVREIEFY